MGDWTKEPWPDWWPNMVIGEDKAALSHAEYQRARACVNALAGIDDPEAFVRDVRAERAELVETLQSCEHLAEREAVTCQSTEYAAGADRRLARIRALLAKLPGGAS